MGLYIIRDILLILLAWAAGMGTAIRHIDKMIDINGYCDIWGDRYTKTVNGEEE